MFLMIQNIICVHIFGWYLSHYINIFYFIYCAWEQLNTVETFKYLCIIKLFHYNENKDKPRIFSFKKRTELLIHSCRFLDHAL